MKTSKILLAICFIITGCGQHQNLENTFSFKTDKEELSSITLLKYDFDREKMVELKTLTNVEPKEVYNITYEFSEPSIYAVKTDLGKEMKIAVEKNGVVQLVLSDEIAMDSEVANQLKFNHSIENLNKQFFAEMIQEFDLALKENDQEKIAQLEKKKDEVLVKFIGAMENLVRDMGPSAQAYDALAYFDLYKNNDFFHEMLKAFEQKYPMSGMSKSLRSKVENADKLKIGGKLDSFSAANRSGEQVNLLDYNGTYVLVDFWASWCRPCRLENPKLLELYENFKGVKFEIVGISIDTDKDAWEKAIQKDGLVWNQIWDKEQIIYKQYLLSSLPANFLLDQDGGILAKNITAKELKTKLETLK